MQEIRSLLQSEEPIRWLFYGDSITHGALHTQGQRDYTQLFAERVRYELVRPMDVVINTAISGHTTEYLLEGFDWRVAQFSPHVVFLMIGMNDCSDQIDISLAQFEQNLNELADRMEMLDSRLVLQTTCPILQGVAAEREPYFDDYMEAIRRVAAARELPLVDHTKFWLEHADRKGLWMSDAFHPNGYGHQAFALLLYEAMGIYDPESLSCQLALP
ncbi:MAG: SGNH/GDSL hydrolase family protein [Candidatus Latescibacterota bacterium]